MSGSIDDHHVRTARNVTTRIIATGLRRLMV